MSSFTPKQIELIGGALGKTIKELVLEMHVFPLVKRVEALEQQSADLKYVGVWSGDREYRKGNFATHGGSVWHADVDTTEKPGASNDWTLAVKSGREVRS